MKYIASWSGGKDSTASIILAHEHKEPLDLIIFSEVMFDKDISGELPEHIEFIKDKAIPQFEEWGYQVKILKDEKTYMDYFLKKFERSKTSERNGKKYGFPMMNRCVINSRCKMPPIRQFWKSLNYDYTQYVGIAKEEKVRLERLVKTKNTISLLKKYNYTEKDAFELCKKYNLLSPVYEFTKRGGCWFCPSASPAELRHLYNNHKGLWNKLLDLENEPDLIGYCWNTLKKQSIHDWDKRFKNEDKYDFKIEQQCRLFEGVI
nr:MAG TPA: phosphoadenosine-phosphosulfate reductase [Caudoviricetes sp.]